VKREAPRVVYTFCWIQNNEHHSPRTSISSLSSQTFNALVVFFFVLFPSLIKTQNFSNVVLLQTVKSSWYTCISSRALSTALVFSLFHLFFLSFISFIFFPFYLFLLAIFPECALQSFKTGSRFHLDTCSVGTGNFSPWVKLPGRWAEHSSQLEPRWRMRGANIPLPSTPSWRSRNEPHCTIFRCVRKIAKSDY
jgi:hypothetical protein